MRKYETYYSNAGVKKTKKLTRIGIEFPNKIAVL